MFSLSVRKMQLSTTLGFLLVPVRMAVTKTTNKEENQAGEGVDIRNPPHIADGDVRDPQSLGGSLKNVKRETSQDPAVSPGYFPKAGAGGRMGKAWHMGGGNVLSIQHLRNWPFATQQHTQ